MKKYRLSHIILALILIIAFSACGGRMLPAGVMDEETMEHFLTEAFLIDGYYAVESGHHYEELASEAAVSYDELFKKYHISRDDYEKSMDYYIHHEDKLSLITQRVMSNLEAVR